MNKIVSELQNLKSPMILRCEAHVPYDGCWHEPNYFLASSESITPLYISGPLQKQLLADPCPSVKDFVGWISDYPGDNYDAWRLIDLNEFSPPENLHNGLFNLLAFLGCSEALLPHFRCDQCGEEKHEHACFLGYRGNGGVGVDLTDPVCEECFEKLRWCSTCHSYILPDDRQLAFDIDDPHELVCPFKVEEACAYAQDGETEIREHKLSDPVDEGERFGMGPTAGVLEHAEGPPPVIMIWQKNEK